jgi:hypothetical protein
MLLKMFGLTKQADTVSNEKREEKKGGMERRSISYFDYI